MRQKLRSNLFAALCCASLLIICSCVGENANSNLSGNRSNASQAESSNANTVSDANLDAEIERLERHAERNPTDDAVREQIASLYVRRGHLRRNSGDLKSALNDYRRAINLNAENEEAQKNAAELWSQIGGGKEDEYGGPEPAPITPNVTITEEEPTPTPQTTNRNRN